MRLLFACLCVSLSLSLSLSVWGVPTVSAADSWCTWTEPDTHQRFDFDQLSITPTSTWQGYNNVGGWNTSTPCTTDACDSSKDYQYLFNLCAPLAKKPQAAVCDGTALESAIAFQYSSGRGVCYRAGKFNPSEPSVAAPVYKLLQTGKPSQGFTVSYQSGDPCRAGNRKFTLHLRCSANLPADPQLSYDNSKMAPMNARLPHMSHGPSSLSLASSSSCTSPDCHIYIGSAYEDPNDKCEYHVHINTVFGCPSSCRTGDFACSAHGICAEDTDAKVTRCFCDKGWGGDTCQTAVDTSSATTSRSPNTVLTVFVLILLFAALGLGYALYRKIRGFHGDFDHQYGQLGDDAGVGAKTGRGGIQINNA